MKFKDYLAEAPYILDDLEPSEIKSAVPTWNKFKSLDTKKVGSFKKYTIYKGFSGSKTVFYLSVDEKNEKVVAYNKIMAVNISTEHSGYKQVLVWRDPSTESEIIYHVIDKIISEYGTLYSDDTQSYGGKSLWKTLLTKYIKDSSYEVGYYFKGSATPIKTDLDKIFQSQYGKRSQFYIKHK